jgi:histone acetyltransferase (RNA polymerase elongator complex component)
MVLEGTGLARMWRAGEYEPWGLNETVGLLAPALLRFWEAGIRVIRIGLAPEPSMQAGLLAGPAHPALGQLIRSRALFLHVEQRVRELGREPVRLEVPDRYASDVKGHKGSMAGVYEGLGLARDKIRIIRGSVFRLG